MPLERADSVTPVSINPGWSVGLALALLLALALAAHRISGYGMERPVLVAAVRACVQLGLAATFIAVAVNSLLLSVLLVAPCSRSAC
jgi:putative ABC transport system permease protein